MSVFFNQSTTSVAGATEIYSKIVLRNGFVFLILRKKNSGLPTICINYLLPR